MTSTKIKHANRLAAAKRLVIKNGGQQHIDQLPLEEGSEIYGQMVDALAAEQSLSKAVASQYVARALEQPRYGKQKLGGGEK